MNTPDPEVTAVCERVAAYLATAIATMRPASRHAVLSWVHAAESDLGGTLVLQAPTGRRDLPEAVYASERWPQNPSFGGLANPSRNV